ncbi:hypothetical protein B2H97_16045 [Paraclostridium bifermentans]|uniref:phage tail spike protein n=1 Tax=Paraclostridium bifermentans TaxID=1490 RepID=UPI000A216A42|nr:phage tail spike protein [Paraclostridium bifermentans]OSB07979.1 hypothetical protein B2H97_16045 [Paraclostridium bifermentans]
MLQLRDIHKKKIAGLTEYKNLYIESELQSGDKTLCFSYPKKAKYHSDIVEECYLDTKENEYIVKEKNVGSEYTSFKCILNLEDLEGQPFERYASEEQTIDKALSLALAGTGWIVGMCNLKKRRTVRISNCSSLDIIKEIKKIYRCDLVFNTLTKTIDVYEKLGEDKGAYFIDSLNLKDLSIQGNSYDYYTRIIPIGKDDLRISSINNGKDYVENFQYSNKIKTFYWKDERYTVIENLKEDASAKLEEISKPYRSYSAEILNLAKLNDKYKNILDFKLGDTITLISKENKFRDKQRIVKIIEHPDEHELDTVELANTTLSFEETQTQFQEAADTVDNITTDNGTIDGSTVDNIETKQISDFEANVIKVTNLTVVNAKIHNLEAQNVNITGKLTAVEATIGTLNSNLATIDKLTVTHSAYIADLQASKVSITQLEAVNATIQVLEGNVSNFETSLSKKASIEQLNATNVIIVELQAKKANIDDLNATNAIITELKATKADIKDLQATNANITNLNSDLANIKTLVNGNLSSENIQAGGITSDKLTIANGFITNAMIDNLDVSKVNAGDISTNKFRITSNSGNMLIADNTIQIRDSARVRVQIGKDASNDYNMYIWDYKGNLMFDATGLKANGIKDKIIRNEMISDNANIDGNKLNITSVVSSINNGSTTIKSSKIQIDGTNQTLDVSFNSLKTEVQNIEIGGRNLALDTDFYIEKEGYKNYNFDLNTLKQIRNRKVTVSVEVNLTNVTATNTSGSRRVGTEFSIVYADGSRHYIGVWENLTEVPKTMSKRISQTWVILDKEIIDFTQRGVYVQGTISGEVKVGRPKIEFGTKPTDWSPAPEDIGEEITGLKEITTSQSTTISVMQGQISTAINNTQIVKDGQTILLKDDYNRTVQTVNSINSTLGSHTTQINEATGKITSVDTKVNSVQRDLESTKISVSSNSSKITDLNTITKNQSSDINVLKNQISLKVEQSDIEKSINETQKVTDEKISNAKAEIKITTDAINQTVSSLNSTISNKADNSTVTNVSNKVTSLETNLNSITGKVSNLETSVSTKADKSTTYTKTETDALINVKADEINLNLTKNYSSKTDLTNAINDIEIGGRNLFKGHKNNQEVRLNDYQGVGGFTQFSNNLTFNPADFVSKEFTISFYAKSPNGMTQLKMYNQNGDPRYFYFSTTLDNALGNAWKYYRYTFTNTDRGSNYPISNKVEIYAPNKMGVLVKNIKVEIGNKATDWTPAPEDIEILTDEKISSAKSEIKITTDSIKQDLSNLTTTVSTKADNSTVTSMSNKVASLETSLNGIKGEVSSLETTTTTISSKVNQAQSDATKGINDAKTASDKALSAQNTSNANKNNITTLTTEVTTVKSNIATLDVNLKGITQRVISTESTTTSLNTQMNKLISPHGMPYTKDLIIYGDSNKYYPVYIIGGNQDILRTIKIWRSFSDQAPSDWNTSTHKGSLMLTWQGNFGGWGGADYKEFILENSSQYTQLLADCYISVHCMGYTFFLRGGGTTGAIYHFASDQVIDPKVYYNGSSDLVWSNSNTVYNVYAFAPVTIVNTDRLNSLKIAKESSVNKVTNKVSEIEVNLSSITSRVSNVESKQTNIDGKVVSLETWKREAEQKITDSSIISVVSKQFYSKGETDSKYTTQSQFTQLSESFEFKLTQSGSPNLVANSNFDAEGYKWYFHNGPSIDYNASSHLNKWYGRMIAISCNGIGGIYQRFPTIAGEKYTVSFYAEADRIQPLETNIGIEGIQVITLKHEPGFKRWSFTFTATGYEHTFIAYTINPGTFYIGRIMVNKGGLREYSKCEDEIYSSKIRIDIEGITAQHDNGSYSQLSPRGLEHWENGMSKPYHYITDVKIVDARGKCDGTWFTVYLGDYFRGKHCDLAWQMGNISLTYGRCLSGYEVDCRNYNWQAGTVEMSVKVFYKSEWAGGAGYDKDAYAWGKIFIWY